MSAAPQLFFDTETTGLPLFNDPSEDPRQPHIVQLAAALVDPESRQTVASMDVVIRPDGWVIPEEVSRIHGITTERALEIGVPERMALQMLLDLWASRERVAHNETFDARIVRIAMKRYLGADDPAADRWKAGAAQCTARLMTPVCKLPPTEKMRAAGRTHFKTPNLAEAYRHFYGDNPKRTHAAMADVQSCIAIFFALQDYRAKNVAA